LPYFISLFSKFECKYSTFSAHSGKYPTNFIIFSRYLQPLFSRQSLSNPPSPPSPLFIRWGLDLFSKPLSQSLGTRLKIDYEGKPSPSKFWYGSPAFAPSGFAIPFLMGLCPKPLIREKESNPKNIPHEEVFRGMQIL